jgi:formate--tetrahydrofolate ligase
MKSDIEIARSVKMRRITEIAESIGIPQEEISQYGHFMAKVPLSLINEEKVAKS